LATLFLFGLAFPILWGLLSSFKPEEQILGSPSLWPSRIVMDHYRDLWRERDFLVPIRNSLIVAGATTILCVAVGTLCAYALTRLRFRGKVWIMGLVLAVAMFPQISIVSPLYLLLRKLHLINTYPGLILPYMTFAMPLAIWFLVSYFRHLPLELEEAAMVDGAGRLRILREIVLPLALPAIGTTALSFTLEAEKHTVPVAIALFRGRYQVPWGQVLAATMVSTAPVAAAVLVFQRRIVRGLTAGALRG
jgi:ABC-type glycerol-3-phosphate transport system permease component